MSESLTLTPAEVQEVTGAVRRSKQLGWFLRNGIPAVLGDDGKVKVLRAAYCAKMMPSIIRPARPKTEPRLDRLKKAS